MNHQLPSGFIIPCSSLAPHLEEFMDTMLPPNEQQVNLVISSRYLTHWKSMSRCSNVLEGAAPPEPRNCLEEW